LSLNSFFQPFTAVGTRRNDTAQGGVKQPRQGEFFGVRPIKLNFRFIRRKIFAARKKRRLRRRLLYSGLGGRLKSHFIIENKERPQPCRTTQNSRRTAGKKFQRNRQIWAHLV